MNKTVTMIFFVLMTFSQLIGQGIPKRAYVLNSLGQNLSVINLETGSVTIDALPLGLFTNVLRIHDDRAFSVNSGVNEVQVINLNPLATVDHIDVGNGTNPWSLDFVNDSLAAVSLLFTNQAAIINVNSGQVLQYVPVGTGPEGVKYYGGRIYVANSGFNGVGYDPGTVNVIDAGTFAVIDTFNVGTNPQDLAVDSQGRLVVVCTGDYATINGQVDIIDLNNGSVVTSIPFSSWITAVGINSQDECYVGTSGSGVMVYNLISQSFERSESNPLPGGPGIDFDKQDNVYITDFGEDSVRVFSSSHQKLASYRVGDGPLSIGIYNFDRTSLTKPEGFQLHQNYPNPFNTETVIGYQLTAGSNVELTVYNLLGQPIKKLVNEKQSTGSYQVVWNGKDESGEVAPSGVYYYRLKVGSQNSVRQMRLVK